MNHHGNQFQSNNDVLLNMKWNINSNIFNKLCHDFILNYTVLLWLCQIIDGHFVIQILFNKP